VEERRPDEEQRQDKKSPEPERDEEQHRAVVRPVQVLKALADDVGEPLGHKAPGSPRDGKTESCQDEEAEPQHTGKPKTDRHLARLPNGKSRDRRRDQGGDRGPPGVRRHGRAVRDRRAERGKRRDPADRKQGEQGE